MDMYIVLDANIIIKEDYGNSLHFNLLLSGLKDRQHKVYVPRLAIEEVHARLSRWLDSETKTVNKSLSDVSRRLSLPLQSPFEGLDVQEWMRLFRQRLYQKFDLPDTAILDYPDVSHEHLVKKAIARKKPFNEKGSGYRDALIWETVVACASNADAQVLLITADKDFRESADKDDLHPDLIKDLVDRGLASDRVILSRSIADFIDKHMRPYLKELSPHLKKLSWENPIQVLRDWGYDLEDEVATALQNSYSTYVWSPRAFDLDTDLENLFLDNVQDLNHLRVLDVRETNGSSLLIRMEARLICEFHVFVDKATWYSQVENSVLEILDPDWNRHCVLATVTSELDCEFDCTIDISRPKHCKTQILSMNPVPMSEVDFRL